LDVKRKGPKKRGPNQKGELAGSSRRGRARTPFGTGEGWEEAGGRYASLVVLLLYLAEGGMGKSRKVKKSRKISFRKKWEMRRPRKKPVDLGERWVGTVKVKQQKNTLAECDVPASGPEPIKIGCAQKRGEVVKKSQAEGTALWEGSREH